MISRPPYVVGLTGGIGSGKSAAAQRFAQLGVTVVDTDAIAHELTSAQGEAMPALRQTFGPEMFHPNGNLDRAALREKVFTDSAARKQLELVLHPLIREETARQIAIASGSYAIVVVPLLVEKGGYAHLYNRVLVVDCREETQLARTMQRSRLAEPEVRAIMATQASRSARLAAADDVISNEGTLDELHAQVDRLHVSYLEYARLAPGDGDPSRN
ncbi:MAG: dephospho-CoA kinase [Betaproteobacteria bacterium]|nr:dephospho-CoA kinase [Betaproteobacteria bacterium]